MEKIVIFGGSFDPVHNGHLRIARAASLLLNADVVFIPAKDPRWKTPEATVEDRLAMLKLALEEDGSGAFSIDQCELKRAGEVTYSIDTVRYFHKQYPGRKLTLLIGADEVNRFDQWQDAEEIVSLAEVVYVPRPEVPLKQDNIVKYRMSRLAYGGSGPVSSSDIRDLKSVDAPLKVFDYIEKKNLYYMKVLQQYEGPSRILHSLSVAHLAYAIAKTNMVLNPGFAYVAGMLHDIGKGVKEDQAREILKAEYPEYADYPSWCLHQFLGASLAKSVFGIADPAVLDAIEFHCTGKTHMPPITKIVYSADKIDPRRGFDSSKLINACLKNYYVGFLEVLRENEKYLTKTGEEETTPLSESCRNLYLGKDQ
jgi:nicotinate-nucleotide adenylyltransferase